MRLCLLVSLVMLSFPAFSVTPDRPFWARLMSSESASEVVSDLVSAFESGTESDDLGESNELTALDGAEEAMEREIRAQMTVPETTEEQTPEPAKPPPPTLVQPVETPLPVKKNIEAATVTDEFDGPVMQVRKDHAILPKKAIMKMNDSELRQLCTDLKQASHLGVDSVKGSSAINFRQQAPLILRIDQMKLISNVRADFVALVPGRTAAKVKHLKDVRKPHLVCNVSVQKLSGIENPLIFVNDKIPAWAKKLKRVRYVSLKSKKL